MEQQNSRQQLCLSLELMYIYFSGIYSSIYGTANITSNKNLRIAKLESGNKVLTEGQTDVGQTPKSFCRVHINSRYI